MQARWECRIRRRKPPACIPQARLAPEEILGFGIGEENPAIPVKENGEPGLKKAFIFFGNSGGGRRTGQGGLKKPADELRLAGGSGFRKNALCVLARRRLAAYAEFA
jgi:hypothetical protein